MPNDASETGHVGLTDQEKRSAFGAALVGVEQFYDVIVGELRTDIDRLTRERDEAIRDRNIYRDRGRT